MSREPWFIDDRPGHVGDITDGERTICTVWPWPPYDENVRQERERIMLEIVRAHNAAAPASAKDGE